MRIPFNIRQTLCELRDTLSVMNVWSVLSVYSSAKPQKHLFATVRNTKSYHFDEWIYDGKKDIIISPSGFQVSLSQKETKILKVFLANSHIALSREEIANAIDDTREQEKALDNLESRAIDVLVGRLRTKIEKDTKKPSLIKTERGVGYIFSCEVITKDE